jgi:sarcosine oxidase gamma subunit
MKIYLAMAMGLFATASSAVPGQPVLQPSSALAAVTALQPGQWTLRDRESPSESRSLCVTDTHALLQVRHGAAVCSRFVIASDAHMATVHYTCPGTGHGRTTIRVENPRLVQIETQGIVKNEPFSIMWEGRRTGECTAKQTSSR